MKFMYTWKPRTGATEAIVKRFLAGDAAPPAGATHLARWHRIDTAGGFSLIETDDLGVLYKHIARWSTLMDFEVLPVIEDEQAAPVLAEVFGKKP